MAADKGSFGYGSFVVDNVDSGDETVPLLPKKHIPQADYGKDDPDDESRIFRWAHDKVNGGYKVIMYDHDSLLSWRTLIGMGQSAFANHAVFTTFVYCCALASICALAIFHLPAASLLDTSKLQRLSLFFKVFIAFMIGVYIGDAFKRWWTTVSLFERFLTSIRALVFMLHTVDAAPDFRKNLKNYCVASAYILNLEVHNVQTVDNRYDYSVKDALQALAKKGYINEGDIEELGRIELSSMSILGTTRAVWSWVGEALIEPDTEDGLPVHPNMMVRLNSLCQQCVSDLENLKMNIIMQPPFMYAHLLAVLVHFNNTILAISGGVAVGSALNEIHKRSEQLAGDRTSQHSSGELLQEFVQALQIAGVQALIILLGPMLYMAFLHIAHMLCYPFGDKSYHLPTETFIDRLDEELQEMSLQRTWMKEKTKCENSPRLPVRQFPSGVTNTLSLGMPSSPGFPTSKNSSPLKMMSPGR